MALGDIVSAVFGPYDLSGALVAKLNSLNLSGSTIATSNGQIHIVPLGNGQVNIITTKLTS
jgi:hypothetical protein